MKCQWSSLLILICLFTPAFGQAVDSPGAVVAKVTEAANKLIATLGESQRREFLFNFDDTQQKRNWSNLPVGAVARKGLRWGDLNDKQKDAFMELLKATLSPMGVQQIMDNMEGDEILRTGAVGRGGPAGGGGPRGGGRGGRGGGRGTSFGKDNYFVSILGMPSTSGPWMWQFGGHHLGVNATIVGVEITLAPSLTGGQPVDYELNSRKVRQLAGEEDKSFELIGSMTPDQLKLAVLADHHADMIWGPGREGAQPKDEGINASQLSKPQQELLLDLIGERIGILNEVHAKQRMNQISRDLDKTWFAWFGPTKRGEASSFRIQGPTILIEYAPQHLGGDSTNHTHAMYRDPTNDYGARFLNAR